MTAGELRDRVTWLPPKRDTNESGQAVVTYPSELAEPTFAKVEPVAAGAGEGDQHAQLTPRRAYQVTIRSRTVDVRHDWRLTWRALTLDVTAVLPHEAGDDFVKVMCRERPPTTTVPS